MTSRLSEIATCSLDEARDALRSSNFHIDEALLLLLERNHQSTDKAGMQSNRKLIAKSISIEFRFH